MKNAQFDSLVRVLGSGASRRGVLAGVAGVAGLWAVETDAGRRKRAESRTTKRSKGSDAVIAQKGSSAGTAQTVTIREGCPKKPAESIAILSAYYPGY
jgi:hypothetical protein